MANYDFEFDLGKGRRLKGQGPRGLIALALLLACPLALVWTVGAPFVSAISSGILTLISASKYLF